ncbi:MAG: 4-alpha-glucanotransferase [Gemmatimonadota bacterium]
MEGERGLDPSLAALAAECGVVTSWTDIGGVERRPPAECVLAVLGALGEPVERIADCDEALRARRSARPRLAPVHVAWNGELPVLKTTMPAPSGAARLRIRLEDGSERATIAGPGAWRNGIPLPGPLPLGIHDVDLEVGEEVYSTRIVSAPRIAWRPPRPRTWGVFAPLHGLGPAGTSLPGSYGDLRTLLRRIGDAGGAWVATLPLLATFLDEPFEPSPYAPVSRMFLNELFIDPAAALAAVDDPAPVPAPALAGDPQRIEYGATWKRLRAALLPAAQRFFERGGARRPDFQSFLLDRPAVQDYARFRAANSLQGAPWREWPQRIRHGRLRRGDFDPAEYRFHLFAAWCAHVQLAAAAREGGTARPFLDLPLGVHPDGYDTWRLRHLFATGVAVGAPPDAFFERGQNWGFPPIVPEAQRAEGYGYFLECLRVQLQHAGALRLDHVMRLERLFWVPDGFEPVDGVYIRYPREEMLALLALESHRHETLIVGEDLGTVTPTIRTAMREHALQRMYVVQFEAARAGAGSLPGPDADAVASFGTHDLPTFAAWLRGIDIEQDVALGRITTVEAPAHLARRERMIRSLAGAIGLSADPPEADGLLRALLARLAATPARVVVFNLEDAWLETRRTNVPGTTTEHPNWRQRTPFDAGSALRDPRVAELLALIDRERRDPAPAARERP